MAYFIITIINIISILFILLNIFILLTICRIHSKKKNLRIKYFGVVFTQIILELLLNIIFLITIFFSLLMSTIQNKYLYIFSVLINFLYNIDIIYNIQTIISLVIYKNKVDSNDVFSNDDTSKSDEFGNSNTIDVKSYSFKKIHFFSFFASLIHSIFFFFVFFDKNKKEIEFDWYFFFYYKEEDNLKYLFLFVFNYIFVISSIRYCFVKQKINETIKLKHYSIYTFIISLISLIFPIKIILNKFYKKNDLYEKITTPIYSFLILVYLFENSYFRLNCYYIQNILSKKGDKFCSKIEFGIKILLSKKIAIPTPNFIDFNNSFLFHSLSSPEDFYDDRDQKIMKGIEGSDGKTSKSFSLTDT